MSKPLQVCWAYLTNKVADLEFASDNNKILYIPFLDGKIAAVTATSGEKRWETELGGEILNTPLLDENSIYIVTGSLMEISQSTNENKTETKKNEQQKKIKKIVIRALDKSTGITLWKSETLNYTENEKGFFFSDLEFLFYGGSDGNIYSINKNSGQIVWKKELDSPLSYFPFVKIVATKETSMLVSNSIYLISGSQLISLSLIDGTLLSKLQISLHPTFITSAEIINDTLIIGDKKGYIESQNSKTGKQLWKIRIGAEVSNISATESGLLVTSLDNFVYLLAEKNGNLIWKKRLTSRVLAKPFIEDNYVVLIVVSEPTAAIIELDSGKMVNKIILGKDDSFIIKLTKLEDLYVYATLNGIFASAARDSCPLK